MASKSQLPTRYSPGELAIDEELVLGQLQNMSEELLPTYGMAYHYLAASPIRDAAQCLLASTVLMLSMRSLGVTADLTALELTIPWGGGGRGVHYGNPAPHFDVDTLKGHVGLFADGHLIDATASQFPEIRENGGVRPLLGFFGDNADIVAAQGADVGLRMKDGQTVSYHVHRLGSADRVGLDFMDAQTDPAALPTAILNTLTGFGVMLANARGTVNPINRKDPRKPRGDTHRRVKVLSVDVP